MSLPGREREVASHGGRSQVHGCDLQASSPVPVCVSLGSGGSGNPKGFAPPRVLMVHIQGRAGFPFLATLCIFFITTPLPCLRIPFPYSEHSQGWNWSGLWRLWSMRAKRAGTLSLSCLFSHLLRLQVRFWISTSFLMSWSLPYHSEIKFLIWLLSAGWKGDLLTFLQEDSCVGTVFHYISLRTPALLAAALWVASPSLKALLLCPELQPSVLEYPSHPQGTV